MNQIGSFGLAGFQTRVRRVFSMSWVTLAMPHTTRNRRMASVCSCRAMASRWSRATASPDMACPVRRIIGRVSVSEGGLFGGSGGIGTR